MAKTLGFLILLLPFTVQAQINLDEDLPADLENLIVADALNDNIYDLMLACKKDIYGNDDTARFMMYMCNPIHEKVAHMKIEELLGPIRPMKNGIFEKTMRASARSQHIFRIKRVMIKKYDLQHTYFDMIKYNLAFYTIYNG